MRRKWEKKKSGTAWGAMMRRNMSRGNNAHLEEEGRKRGGNGRETAKKVQMDSWVEEEEVWVSSRRKSEWKSITPTASRCSTSFTSHLTPKVALNRTHHIHFTGSPATTLIENKLNNVPHTSIIEKHFTHLQNHSFLHKNCNCIYSYMHAMAKKQKQLMFGLAFYWCIFYYSHNY